MKHTKIVLLTAAVVMMTQALGLSVAAEEETSAQSGEESVIDADSLSSDESSKETLTSGDYSYTLDGDNATITSTTAAKLPLRYRTSWTGTPLPHWAAAHLPPRI